VTASDCSARSHPHVEINHSVSGAKSKMPTPVPAYIAPKAEALLEENHSEPIRFTLKKGWRRRIFWKELPPSIDPSHMDLTADQQAKEQKLRCFRFGQAMC